MEEKLIELIREYAEENDFQFRDNYSGRGMYGNKCAGLSGDFSLMEMIGDVLDMALDELDEDEYRNALYMLTHRMAQDSMGMGTIVYWPDLQAV